MSRYSQLKNSNVYGANFKNSRLNLQNILEKNQMIVCLLRMCVSLLQIVDCCRIVLPSCTFILLIADKMCSEKLLSN